MNLFNHLNTDAPIAVHPIEQEQLLSASYKIPLAIGTVLPNQRLGLTNAQQLSLASAEGNFKLIGVLPPIYPESLGNSLFHHKHRVRYAYIGGEMARGIASVNMVIELAKIGALGFFGAAGLTYDQVRAAIHELKLQLNPLQLPFGVNLIHSPAQPKLEEILVDLYLQENVNRISASAFMDLSSNIVRYACHGLKQDAHGFIQRKNYVFAKISRLEIAEKFMKPAPAGMLQQLVAEGKLTQEEAFLAQQVPIAEDITVESDSGGHTDNRPLCALFSAVSELRNTIQKTYQYKTPIRLGAAGSISTPRAVASAFALGADYIVIASAHQAAMESGLSMSGKQMLADAGIADVIMTAAADMFEQGVKVQILKKGSMMGLRGNMLYELYKRHSSLEELSEKDKENLEKNIFRMPLEQIWLETKEYFTRVEPVEVARAESDSKYKMALVFRWYLGKSSRWPIIGDETRKMDYQIWCGPAMGAFNDWARGSFLEKIENRRVAQIALNLLYGAAHVSRVNLARIMGLYLLPSAYDYRPVQFNLNISQAKEVA